MSALVLMGRILRSYRVVVIGALVGAALVINTVVLVLKHPPTVEQQFSFLGSMAGAFFAAVTAVLVVEYQAHRQSSRAKRVLDELFQDVQDGVQIFEYGLENKDKEYFVAARSIEHIVATLRVASSITAKHEVDDVEFARAANKLPKVISVAQDLFERAKAGVDPDADLLGLALSIEGVISTIRNDLKTR